MEQMATCTIPGVQVEFVRRKLCPLSGLRQCCIQEECAVWENGCALQGLFYMQNVSLQLAALLELIEEQMEEEQ